jgi:lipopolysaccharide export system permease protein
MFRRIDRYIIGHIMGPFLMTLAIAALLLLLERMLRLFDFVVNQGGPVEVVFRMLGSLIPHYMGFALPIGLFVGILVAFRKLSLSSELDAMQANGIGLSRLLRPVMGLSILMMIVNIILIGFVQPHSRYTYKNLEFDLRSGALGASVKVGEFVNIGDNMVLRIDESRDNGAELLGIFLERMDKSGKRIAVTAKRGGFFSTNNRQHVILRLFEGRLVDLEEKSNKPRVLTFKEQDIIIKLPTIETFRARGEEHKEMTFPELYDEVMTAKEGSQNYNVLRGAYHLRLMSTITFLMLPFLAIPLGITSQRSGNSLGLVIGMSLLILYNELLEVAQRAVSAGEIGPYEGMWSYFILYLGMSLWFFHVKAHRVGGDPLSWLRGVWDLVRAGLNWLIRPLKEGWS